jgi:hypothetical protein
MSAMIGKASKRTSVQEFIAWPGVDNSGPANEVNRMAPRQRADSSEHFAGIVSVTPEGTMPESTRTIAAGVWVLIVALLFVFSVGAAQQPNAYFKITVIDEETNRGVPMVEFISLNAVRYLTDSNGILAFYEPHLMNRTLFFEVRSHGYKFAKLTGSDDLEGKAIKLTPGGSEVLKIKRINVAERLYRITGEGIYRDSVLLGESVPIQQPLLNGQVMGQDGAMVVPFNGRLFWTFGDTNGPNNLNLSVSAATSRMPGQGGLDPDKGIDLEYFVDDTGFSKPMCRVQGKGVVWIYTLITLKDEAGNERLLARYDRRSGLTQAYERGLALFNEEKSEFEPLVNWGLDAPVFPEGTPFRVRLKGEDYLYFSRYSPAPAVRVKARWKEVINPAAYEAFTPLLQGIKYEKTAPRLDRDANGQLVYAWRSNTAPLSDEQRNELLSSGQLKAEEAYPLITDMETGKVIRARAGSVQWNEFRKRWVMIAQETGGTSNLGEYWYVEGDTPLGPWVYGRKIMTHDKYSFYEAAHHPFLDQDGGRIIFFSGTYSDFLSGTNHITPRYDYNLLMYRMNLADPRLSLPVPVYQVRGEYLLREQVEERGLWEQVEAIPFFALGPNRQGQGAVAIGKPTFYGLQADSGLPHLIPLSRSAADKYSINGDGAKQPLCWVWKNPHRTLFLERGAKPISSKLN